MLTEKRIVNEVAPTAVISHCSHRLRRPTPSSMFAESLALAEASKHGDFFRAVLAELLVPGFEYRKWEWHAKVIHHLWVTDCRSVFDHLARDRGLPQDRQQAIELAALRRDLMRGNHDLRWMPGPKMVADPLTKDKANYTVLHDVFMKAEWTVIYTEECQTMRARTREQARARKTVAA